MFNYKDLYKMLGYKRVFIKSNPIIIKKLTALDFIEEPTGMPMMLFHYRRNSGMFDALRKPEESQEKEKYLQSVLIAKKLSEKAIVFMPAHLKVDDLFDSKNHDAIRLGWELYGHILAHNFKTLSKAYECDRQHIIHIAELCNAMNKRPHEHIANPKRLTELEKYMIDEFVYGTYLENENDKTKRANNG